MKLKWFDGAAPTETEQNSKQILKVKKARSDVKMPKRGTPLSAGFDVFSPAKYVIHPETSVKIPTGLFVEIPTGWALMVFARSGLGVKQKISPTQKVGVIDADYRGEIIVPLTNYGNNTVTIEEGQGMAQLVPVYVGLLEMVEVEELNSTFRGAGGFGSTG